MASSFKTALARITLLALPLWFGLGGTAQGASLFFDDFDGTSLDQSAWRLPTGDGTFFGRTQIKPEFYNSQYVGPVVDNGSVTLQLDTHNASDPNNNSFWGQEIQTRQNFLPGTDGISIETRMRFLGNPPGGLVGGFFTWGYDGTIRDEIDVELLTNLQNTEFFFTNLYNNDTFSDLGQGGFVTDSPFNITDWNTYEIRWLPDRIQWLLNGVQLREQLAVVDGHPSEVRLNIWAPDPGFGVAHNGNLLPTDLAGNQQYQLEIDYVSVATVVPLPPAILFFSSALALLGWVGKRRSGKSVHC